jgi:cysteine protease ATG4
MFTEFVDFDYEENEIQTPASLSDFLRNLRHQFKQGFVSHVKAEDGPVVMMGRVYQGVEDLIQALSKLPWVTYRSGFNPVFRFESEGRFKELTSDSGWGCTIRAGQMLLLTALMRAKGTTEWPDIELLALIQDNFPDAPFALKQVTAKGLEMDRKPGDWFSPSNMCFTIEVSPSQWLLAQHPHNLQAKVFLDGVIFEDQIHVLSQGLPVDILKVSCRCEQAVGSDVCINCEQPVRPQGEWRQPVLVLLPLMLGLNKINAELYSCFKAFLTFPQSVGVIGGKPRSALYIVGTQGDELLYLDPHFVQPSARSMDDLASQAATYVCSVPLLLPLTQAESSLGVGFMFSSNDDLLAFKGHFASVSADLCGLLSVQALTPNYLLFEEESHGQTLVFSDSDSEYILL